MQHNTNSNHDTRDQGGSLHAAGRFALQRHAEARERAPKRSAAMYLRLACSCARQMAKLAPRHPELWALAQTLVVDIIAIARQHEAALFEAGGNQGAAYIGVWIAAEALQIQIADRCAQCIPAVSAAPEPAPAPVPVPDEIVAAPLAASRAPSPPDRAHLAPYAQNKQKSRREQRPRRKDWR